jgi:putative ABC transport system permease protein
MWSSYLKTAWRSLRSHALFSAINVLGLAAGLAVCLLVMTLIWDQVQYDQFHPERDRIVRVLSQATDADGDTGSMMAAAPAPLAEVMQDEIPAVEEATRIGQIRTLASRGKNGVTTSGLYAEPSFFDVFGFEMKSGGDPREALKQPGQILLKPDLAEKLFGDERPIGKTIELENHATFTVAGVVAEPPGDTHLAFDMLASFATLNELDRGSQAESWQNTWTFATYARMEEGASVAQMEALLAEISDRQYAEGQGRIDFSIQPLADIALGPQLSNEIASYTLSGTIVYVLAGLALLVVIAAGFNYVSLSVARAISRSQEVGVRKTTGAGRGHIIAQLMAESVLVAMAALGIAYLLLTWIIPAFNQIRPMQQLGVEVSPSHLLDPTLIGMFVGFAVLTGILAGLYPALRLSSVQPSKILSASPGGDSANRSTWLRTGLAGVQFGLALVFVTVAALLALQVDHMTSIDYGFETEDRLVVDLNGRSVPAIRSELAQVSAVQGVTMTSSHPVSGSLMGVEVWQESEEEAFTIYQYAVDANYTDVMGLTLAAGRSFSEERAADSTSAVVINEEMVERLGFARPDEAIGTTLRQNTSQMVDGETVRGETGHEIIGVVKNYNFELLTEPIGPVMLYTGPSAVRQAIVQVRPGRMEAATEQVSAVWSNLKPLHEAEVTPLATRIFDSPMNQAMKDASSVVGIVSLLAMLISSLGLLGTAVHMVERRRKEVGVRKALGATQKALVWLLSRRYVALVAGTSIVALPLAWLLNRAWLQVFAYRISVSPWVLGAAALVLGGIALAVIATQTFRAAGTDPAQVLRTE